MVVEVPTRDFAATGVELGVRQQVEEALKVILDSTGCRNIFVEDIPPVAGEEDFVHIFQVKEFNEVVKDGYEWEAWLCHRTGITHDPLTRGTYTQYQQRWTWRVTGFMFINDFTETFRALQDRVETLMYNLEKNKDLLGTVEEIGELRVEFTPVQLVGSTYFYAALITFNALVRILETGGRSVA